MSTTAQVDACSEQILPTTPAVSTARSPMTNFVMGDVAPVRAGEVVPGFHRAGGRTTDELAS